jgi:hypothetical protein
VHAVCCRFLLLFLGERMAWLLACWLVDLMWA